MAVKINPKYENMYRCVCHATQFNIFITGTYIFMSLNSGTKTAPCLKLIIIKQHYVLMEVTSYDTVGIAEVWCSEGQLEVTEAKVAQHETQDEAEHTFAL